MTLILSSKQDVLSLLRIIKMGNMLLCESDGVMRSYEYKDSIFTYREVGEYYMLKSINFNQREFIEYIDDNLDIFKQCEFVW